MDFENLVTNINNSLPDFNTRLIYILFLILLLSLSSIIDKAWNNTTIKIFRSKYLVLSLSVLITLFSFYILKNSLVILNNIYIYTLFLTYILIFFLKHFLYFRNRISLIKKILTFELFTGILITFTVLIISLFTVPNISLNVDPNSKDIEMELTFSSPIKKNEYELSLIPEVKYDLEYSYFLNIKYLITSVKIYPRESFLPDQKVVIYSTGIQRIFPNGKKHEISKEFFINKEPEVEEVVLGKDIHNVNVKDTIKIDLNSSDLPSIEWEAIFTPEVQYQIHRDMNKEVVITPLDLKQGSMYNLKIVKSVIKYDPVTLTKLSTESEEVVKELQFETTPPPGILSFNRSEGIVSNKEPLIINFEIPLLNINLENRVSIYPQIEGSFTLSSDFKQIIFTPTQEFEKNTQYTITILKGLENISGGYTEDDIIFSFSTPGYVNMSSIVPSNGSSNILVTTKNLTITFNQPVDHNSVEEKFNISPLIDGTFQWEGDTLTYVFNRNLSFGTKYTITIDEGIKSIYGLDSNMKISSSFTTKPETFTLNVPQYYQSESFTCNLAATRMALGYRDISVSEASIKESIGVGLNPDTNWVDKYGVHWSPLSSYISNKGRSSSVKRGWSLSAMLTEVRNGNPSIAYVYNNRSLPKGAFTLEGGFTGYKGMHSEVVIGYIGSIQKPTTIITNDPWTGKRYYKTSNFLSVWSYLNNTAIVIY